MCLRNLGLTEPLGLISVEPHFSLGLEAGRKTRYAAGDGRGERCGGFQQVDIEARKIS